MWRFDVLFYNFPMEAKTILFIARQLLKEKLVCQLFVTISNMVIVTNNWY